VSRSEHQSVLRGRLLDDGRRLALAACVVIIVSLFLPWYQKSVAVPGTGGGASFAQTSISAWGSFTWVDAAILLVAVSVAVLLYLRGAGHRIELPWSDGTTVALAGGWTIVLVMVLVFDKPTVSGLGATVGLQWGLLVAICAAGALLGAGLLMRSSERHGELPATGGVTGEAADEVADRAAARREEAAARREDSAARRDEPAARRDGSTARSGASAARRDDAATRSDAGDVDPTDETLTVPPRWRRPAS
jgi:hypothetical protein